MHGADFALLVAFEFVWRLLLSWLGLFWLINCLGVCLFDVVFVLTVWFPVGLRTVLAVFEGLLSVVFRGF